MMLPEGIHRFAVADHPIFPSLDPDHSTPTRTLHAPSCRTSAKDCENHH